MPVFSHTLYLHSFAAQRPGSVGGSAAAPASALYGEKWKYGLCPFFLTPCTSTASLHKGRGAWAGALRPLPPRCTGRSGNMGYARFFSHPVPPQLRCTKAGERGRERCGPCLRVVRGEVEIWAMPVFSHTLYLHSFAAQRPGSVGGSAAAPAFEL